MGNFRQQSQGEVLLDHRSRQKTASSRRCLLGAVGERDGPSSRHGEQRRRAVKYFFQEFFNRVRSFFRDALLDQELNEEMAAHLEMAADENMRRGMPEE